MLNYLSKPYIPFQPVVTLGVTSYNYSMYIIDALNSLLTQTYNNIELIIVDDHSTDNCPALIEAWIKENNINCKYIHHTENKGITKTLNEVVSLAGGKYILHFATDDMLMPERIERQVKILEDAGDEYGVCYANVNIINEHGQSRGRYTRENEFVKHEGDVLEAYLLKGLSFATPGCLLRTGLYKKTGLYDERILIEDYNFWLRAFASTKVKYCDYPGLIYRKKEQSDIFDKWALNGRERYYRDRILSNIQALPYTKNKKVLAYLREKNTQYLKALSSQKSKYLRELLPFLIKKGYLRIPVKVAIKFILGK